VPTQIVELAPRHGGLDLRLGEDGERPHCR
jgi:hypothetical protein